MKTLTAISLFSGTGMLDRGVGAALKAQDYDLRTILYCERETYAQEVLKARMQDKLLCEAPIWSDVTTLDASQLRGHVDCIIAGFPCQPFSVAGKRAGIEDERYLFGDVLRITNEAGAALLFLENVPGLLSAKSDTTAPIADVMRLLDEAGFDATWQCHTAEEAGAPHKRERWFCIAWRRELADSECDGQTGTKIEGITHCVSAEESTGQNILPYAA
ncbi:MAG: DNA cytosine methyltransferase [Acidobacteriaceae bacterium]|nr:DNA cytosine methyltransferase [Acidobacteriaceae bacterium]